MPSIRDEAKDPVWLGSPLETISESEVEVPKGYRPVPPSQVNLNYDFAEYHATYTNEKGVLVTKRRLLIKLHEVPLGELQQYRNFLKNLRNDVDRYVETSSSSSPLNRNDPSPGAVASSLINSIRELPDSSSPEANDLVADAQSKMKKQDMSGAVSSLYRAVSADPKFTRGWLFLGTLLLAQKQTDAGVDAFHKAMAADPNQSAIPKALAMTLMASAQFTEAIPIWQDYMKSHPDDMDGPANLGTCLLKLSRYSEAASAYENALNIHGDRPNLQASLGSAYLLAGDRDKAVIAFRKLADEDTGGKYLNDVAYQMANADLQLPLALEYARKAVSALQLDSQKTTLEKLTQDDLTKTIQLGAYWDTMGWVDERMSNLAEAENYLQSSWKLTLDGIVAGHLCHLYRREHRSADAIRMCRSAISRISMSKRPAGLAEYQTELAAAQENLSYLTHNVRGSKVTLEISDMAALTRTFKLPRFLPGTESAEFFVLLSSDASSRIFKVENVKFITGSDTMKLQGKQLKGIDFHILAPSNIPARFVWRGILGCYRYTGCSFVVLDPADVYSLN